MAESGVIYDVYTDLPPEQLDKLAVEVFRQWVAFSLGGMSLNGYTVRYPTGRMAASISMEREGPNRIAVFADTSVAPEALWIEAGHQRVDLKQRLMPGRYPMHRRPGYFGMTPRLWAVGRRASFTGFATLSRSSEGWIIPPMPAYRPGRTLANMARQRAAQMIQR